MVGRRKTLGIALAWCLFACVLGALVVAPAARPASGVTRYVRSSGDNTANDCTDVTNPCQTLQYTIDQAHSGDTVKVGGTVDSNVTVRKSLTIEGWAGEPEAVLDGRNSGTVLTVDGSGLVTKPSVRLDSLLIEHGGGSGNGGGILNTGGATLTLYFVTLSNNSVGSSSGGGIANAAGSTLIATSSTFSGDIATDGGAIYNAAGGTAEIDASTFSGNEGVNSGVGGAIDNAGTLTVTGSSFARNTASQGGAVANEGAATVERSTLSTNSATVSGGAISNSGTLLLAESTLGENSATDDGGAVANTGRITIEGSTLTANSVGRAAQSAGLDTDGRTTLAGDIFAKQELGKNCVFAGSATAGDSGYNIDDDGSCRLTATGSVSDSTAIDNYLDRLRGDPGELKVAALLNTPSPATAQPDPALAAVPETFRLPTAIDGKTTLCSVPDELGRTPATGINCDIGAALLQQTRTTLTRSATTGRTSETVTYTATVYPAPFSVGRVAFFDGSGNPATRSCSAQLLEFGQSGDQAKCTVTYSRARSYTVTATYSEGTGRVAWTNSTSAPLTLDATWPPGVPSAVTVVGGDGRATVSWKAAAANGSSITYTATSSSGRTCTTTGLSCTVTGLTNGKSYTFTVTATNAAGTGLSSAESSAVTPAGLPSAPAGVSVLAGDGEARISWKAAAAHGAKIIRYTVAATAGDHTCSTKGALSCTVTGLVDGKTYYFNVHATNRVGSGPPSRRSNAVRPRDTHPPTPPGSLAGSFSNGLLVLTWEASKDNVGVARYQLLLDGAVIATVARGATSMTVHDYDRNGTGTYNLVAVDAAGNESLASGSVSVQRVARPASAPTKIPRWAWKLLNWQRDGEQGARPKTPKPLPGWYAAWKAWRLQMYEIVG